MPVGACWLMGGARVRARRMSRTVSWAFMIWTARGDPGDLTSKGHYERQGNQNPLVHVYRYVTEGTFDAYLWQTVENKQKFISQIMTSKSPVRSCDDVMNPPSVLPRSRLCAPETPYQRAYGFGCGSPA